MIIGKFKILEKRVIGEPNDPLLIRWILFRVPSLGIFLHKLCKSDHTRSLHSHPWKFFSLVLRGYDEICYINGIEEYHCHFFGNILYRPAAWRHRVIIKDKPGWTLVFVGRNKHKWGFWPNGKFCWWRKYDPHKGICEENPIYPEQTE